MLPQQYACYCMGLITYDQIGDLTACSCHLEPELRTRSIPLTAYPQKVAKTRSHWTAEHDALLLKLIQEHPNDFGRAALKLPFSPSQCQQRFARVLRPGLCKGQWTPSQDQVLIAMASRVPQPGWSEIAAALGDRTDNQVRCRFLRMRKTWAKRGELGSAALI
ncbi:Myb-like DNA-binding domain-containing protein [Spironucleus salmonicida]|uniref:Myb-like DNA-binding domain-containing protein n=1 Tax=Spironucleus salmonicida TaxID=348837 RepID=V6LWF7_9EUKA|nr:Myb-like DNA-binding domain-containing protein [Spironucleus salmonicida]|eukprot:EST48900.1 Myb-like DNA-binding domain-containing protein [Spironucleus salmonicida]